MIFKYFVIYIIICAILLYDWWCRSFVYTSITTDGWALRCAMVSQWLQNHQGIRTCPVHYNLWGVHCIYDPSLTETYYAVHDCKQRIQAHVTLIFIQNRSVTLCWRCQELDLYMQHLWTEYLYPSKIYMLNSNT